jgi:hypothetical protein
MVMSIQGPTQPGNDFNLYIELLKEELDILWSREGVHTWDVNHLHSEYTKGLFGCQQCVFTCGETKIVRLVAHGRNILCNARTLKHPKRCMWRNA